MSLLHFTSGTTGTPKGAIHVHGAVVTHWATGKYALDPAPGRHLLVHRRSRLGDRHLLRHHRAAAAWRDLDRRCGGFRRRALVRASCRSRGDGLVHRADGDPHADEGRGRGRASIPSRQLRFIASVGEPLNPEAVWWGKEVLGLPIHDNWWQTETGGIMIANTPAADIKPGSMGGRCRALRRRSCRGDDGGAGHHRAARSRRANWRCAAAGRRCCAAT